MVQKLLHVPGKRRTKLNAFAGAYVIDRQLLGVQRLAPKATQDRIVAVSFPFTAVNFIADQRISHVGEMDAQLMRPAGQRP